MQFLKTYLNILNEGNFEDTFWADEIDGKMLKVTIGDVIKFLDSNGIRPIKIQTSKLVPIIPKVERDPKRVDAANLEFPIIVSMKNKQFKMVLDGQHRISKAIKNRIPQVSVRVLDLDNSNIPKGWKNLLS